MGFYVTSKHPALLGAGQYCVLGARAPTGLLNTAMNGADVVNENKALLAQDRNRCMVRRKYGTPGFLFYSP